MSQECTKEQQGSDPDTSTGNHEHYSASVGWPRHGAAPRGVPVLPVSGGPGPAARTRQDPRHPNALAGERSGPAAQTKQVHIVDTDGE